MGTRFEVYDAALGLVSALRGVLGRLEKVDRGLADQLRRAASSVALNLAEGNRRMGKDRLHFFRIAAGSAAEVQAALEVARAWGWIEAAPAAVPEAEAETESDRRGRGRGPRPIPIPRSNPMPIPMPRPNPTTAAAAEVRDRIGAVASGRNPAARPCWYPSGMSSAPRPAWARPFRGRP